VGNLDHDLTRQFEGEPLGERIIVTGRVLDGDGRPVRNSLVEIWQANAAGRYTHAATGIPRHWIPTSAARAGASPTTTGATAS
jgi:protocatechuate 3,4-dioxygenase beta subunit